MLLSTFSLTLAFGLQPLSFCMFAIAQRVRLWLTVSYLAILVLLSTMPASAVPGLQLFPGFDKLVHIGMYFGLTLLACWTLHAEEHRRRILMVVLGAVLWGMLMEMAQGAMHAGRTFEWKDVVSNSVGAMVGAAVYYLVGRWHEAEIRDE